MKSGGVVLRVPTLALNSDEWSASCSGRFISGESRGTHYTEARVDSTADKEAAERQTNPYPPGIRTPILQSFNP
jgi:hypothetical protein